MKVILLAAITVDGFIGVDEHQVATAWTTKADLKFFVSKSKEIGTVIMGRKTFATFGRPLKDRRLIVLSNSPESVTVEGVEPTNESPTDLINRLREEGLQAVAIGGGASVYRQFINAGLVDELYISVVPKLFGVGVSLFDGLIDKELRLLEVSTLDDDETVLLHYELLTATL